MGGTPSTGGVPRTYGLGRVFLKESPAHSPRITRARIRRAASYFGPYWRNWLLIIICLAITSGLSVLPPLCIRAIVDSAILGRDTQLLVLLAAAMVGISIASGLVGVLQQTLSARAGQSIMFDLRNQLYEHLQRMSLRFYTSTRAGEIVSRVNNDVNAVAGVATNTLTSIVSNLFILTATSVVIFSMSWKLALIAVTIIPAFYLPSRIVGRIRRRLSKQTQESHAAMLAFLHERLHVGGSVLMKVFGQAEADRSSFKERGRELMELNVKQAIVGRWLFMTLSLFAVVGPALVYWYGGLQILDNELSVGAVVAFAALLGNLYRPMHQLASVYVDIQASLAVFDRIFEYLDLKPEVQDKPNAVNLERTQGHIRFEHVRFAYPKPPPLPTEEEPGRIDKSDAQRRAAAQASEHRRNFALEDLSFDIEPGQRVALVGPSGAGKTTITYLVPRFYDPDAGRIFIDEHDLRDIQQASIRQHIGMVTQETFLFNATVRDNLLYAKQGADHAALVAAAKAANIHDFIAQLPDGYDTVVGERGFRLSGGEKQRVAIARALLKDPEILILDEATSSLDATSEHLIQQALEKLLTGRTSIIIAHRLSTILNSDKILVVDRGQLVAQGTHSALLQQGGLYAELFQQQFGQVLAKH